MKKILSAVLEKSLRFVSVILLIGGFLSLLLLPYRAASPLVEPLVARHASAATAQLPLLYTFNNAGTLYESDAPTMTTSPYLWLAEGGQLNLDGSIGLTPTNALNYQLFSRISAQNVSAQIYVKRIKDNLSNPANRQPYIGESLIARYVDSNNYYYAGIRADGAIVIKKKANGIYKTLAQKAFFSGTYSSTNYNLIPLDTWIGLKLTVVDNAAGVPELTLATDVGRTGRWQTALTATDDPVKFGPGVKSAGMVGIQNDYAYAAFDNLGVAEVAAVAPAPTPAPEPTPEPTTENTLFFDDMSYPDGVVTSEEIYWSKTANSTPWEMTSGTLYAKSGQGWTNVPSSSNNNGVFRLTTRRSDFQDVEVTFDLIMNGYTTTPSTPAVDWDGVHVFLRYQSEYHLYYASIARRDGSVVIKKKMPGGSSNNGTYYSLSSENKAAFPLNQKAEVRATVQNIAGGKVEIKLYANDKLVASAIDSGTGGSPIISGGATGIRGDNANFYFDNFKVEEF